MDPSLEFLRSFDVFNGQGTSTLPSEETEELSFSVICRTREIPGEDDSEDDEERPPEREQPAEEEVSPASLALAKAKRAGKKFAREPTELPAVPDFKDVFKHQ